MLAKSDDLEYNLDISSIDFSSIGDGTEKDYDQMFTKYNQIFLDLSKKRGALIKTNNQTSSKLKQIHNNHKNAICQNTKQEQEYIFYKLNEQFLATAKKVALIVGQREICIKILKQIHSAYIESIRDGPNHYKEKNNTKKK